MKDFLRETDQFFQQYMPPVTRRFFYIIAFTLIITTAGFAFLPELSSRLFILRPSEAIFQFHLHQFFTYMLAHADFLHFFFNILILFFFGKMLEDYFGSRRFGWFMVLSGVFAGLVHTAFAFMFGQPNVGLIGFSGVDYALLTVAVLLYPRAQVLFFFFPVQLRVLGIFFGFLLIINTLASLASFGGGGVSHLAHAAGVVAGYGLLKFPRILDFFENRHIPFLMRRRPKMVKRRSTTMGHPGRHTDPDDLYDDPHWKLDQ